MPGLPMFDTHLTQQHFSRASAAYNAHATLQHTIRSRTLSIAQDYLPQNSLVLDVGCGTGALAELPHGWQLMGADSAQGMCRQALSHMPAVCASVQSLPIASDSVDGVFSNLMLQWATDPDAAVAECLRVLKPSGVAVLSLFVKGTLSELKTAFAALDDAAHVSDFIDPALWSLRLAHHGAVVFEMVEHTHHESYADVRSLMRALKVIGANNTHTRRRRTLTTPAQLARVEAAYPREAGQGGIKASWQVLTLVLGKTS
jgi:malonyl-CoA O-methyltransferase